MSTLPVHTACPQCGRRELELELGCDLQLGICFYGACCRYCQTVLEVVATDPMAQMDFVVRELRCSACGKEGAHAHLHCELDTQRFYYSVHCENCCKSPPKLE